MWPWCLSRVACARVSMFVLCATMALSAAAAGRVSEIRFSGNKVTKPKVLLQEMTIKVGDPIDRAAVETSRQAIMNLGIFKEVTAEVIPAGKDAVVHITIVEKRYVLPLPRVNRNADGDISYGAQIRVDNLMGLNQQFKFTYEETKPAQTDASEIQDISSEFSYPRVQGSPYSFHINGGVETKTLDARSEGYPGLTYGYELQRAGFSVSRLLNDEGPSQGWSVSTGLLWRETLYDDPFLPAALHEDSTRVGVTAGAGFSDVRDYLYSKAGREYGYGVEVGVPALGSDSAYDTHNFYFRHYNLITERPHVSLDYQVRLGLASGGRDAYALGSSSTLRGYRRDSLRGNAFVVTNLEYQQPLFGYKTFRGVVFMDIGNAYPTNNEIDLFDVKSSIGLGVRFNVTALVKVQLRIDYGYALATGDDKTYVGTREAF